MRDRQLNIQRECAVLRGDFKYYVIEEYTNVRKRSEDGKVIVYYSRLFADGECNWIEKAVSVSEYNRIFYLGW